MIMFKQHKYKVTRTATAFRIGSIQICRGTCSCNDSGAYPETEFYLPFESDNVFIIAMANQSGAASRVSVTRAISANGFTWQCYDVSGNRITRSGRYIAIGKWE